METLKIKQENIVVIDDDIPGGGGGGLFEEEEEEEEEETVKVVELNEEAVVLVDDDWVSGEGVVLVGGGGGGGGDSMPCSPPISSAPKPMVGLHETGPSPFLKKTFHMVEDPDTDIIISWTASQKSLVVWDHRQETLKIKQENIVVIDDDIPGGGGGGLIEEEEEETVKVVEVKEEAVVLVDDDCVSGEGVVLVGGGGGGDSMPCSPPISSAPKPMEGLHETGPSPFLKKTFHMVEDPDTDIIISWTASQKSFVVWDHRQFSTNLLPKYFKHNNFSSVICQLYTYVTNFGIETELEKLRNDRMKMKMEIMKLKQQQENTESYLAVVKERIGYTECNQQDILIFMAKAFSNPAFFHQFIHLMGPKKHSEVERLFSASLDEKSSPSQDQKINAAPGPMSPDLSSDNYILWEKLLEDGLICENGSAQVEAELVQHQSKIVLQLENLIAKPPDWASYVKDLGEQVSCLESK
ncbi:hypothetical protein TEA_012562 [Camellia sinensis var. sinensis]|uniref:HSF-type DNA-binding domain-containing protein n=1 Tax=Camellia sinensis var. sinensis TaxID=542762 RepID=A0A4S4E779_CAMSN|nr:hypothetical protein TEA_012562 [Camellia sinensis var. sinensis]